MKVATVVGARPQFIKASAVSRAFAKMNKQKVRIQGILIHTGQHYDTRMSQVFFKELGLPKPDYHLGVGSGFHGQQTGRMIERIETVLQKEKPDTVIVYGDTNSTLAGALAAAKLNIPVAHIEAGLRSYNRNMPEEVNRILTDHLSRFLFCPTDHAVHQLFKEGIKNGKESVVRNVGDVMYDSILYYSNIAECKSTILKDLNLLSTHPSRLTNYYLATIHRAENTDDPKRLKSILKALGEIGTRQAVVVPLHPRTRKILRRYPLSIPSGKIEFIEPLPYFDMLILEKNARAILTDSGGCQKEAYWFNVPCFTLRDETEWVETVKDGWNELVGTEPDRIVQAVRRMENRKSRRKRKALFGNGRASEKIAEILIKY